MKAGGGVCVCVCVQEVEDGEREVIGGSREEIYNTLTEPIAQGALAVLTSSATKHIPSS